MKNLFIFLIFALCIYGAKAQSSVYGVSNAGYISLQQYPAILSISDINFVTDNGDKILKGTERGTFTFKINNSGKGSAVNLKINPAVTGVSGVQTGSFNRTIQEIKPNSSASVSISRSMVSPLENVSNCFVSLDACLAADSMSVIIS